MYDVLLTDKTLTLRLIWISCKNK